MIICTSVIIVTAYINILSNCYRQGTSAVPVRVAVIRGIKLISSTSLTTRVGYESSLKKSLSLGFDGHSVGMESITTLKLEIENSITTSTEKTWSKEVTQEFTVPPGKMYRVVQTHLDFSSPLNEDDCCLYCSRLRVEEQDSVDSI